MEPTLSVTVHVCGRRPRLLDSHLRALAEAQYSLYRRRFSVAEESLVQEIGTLLDRGRYPGSLSSYVRLDLYPDNRLEMTAEGALYRGYALRALHPAAAPVAFALPFDNPLLSASGQAWAAARLAAEARGARIALRTDTQGHLLGADGAHLFALCGLTVYTPFRPGSGEGLLALAALARTHHPVRFEPLRTADIPRIDELFYADHRGITAIERCGTRRFDYTVAARVAAEMERTFTRPEPKPGIPI